MSLVSFRYTWSELQFTNTVLYSQNLLYTLNRLLIVKNYSAKITTKSYIAIKAAEILDEKHNSTSKFIIAEPIHIS
jgi:hypothetical protein